MSDLVDTLTRGNVTEVKVLLASVAVALSAYQLVLISVGYGRLRPSLLGAGPASRAHRIVGTTILLVAVVTALMCVSYFEIEDGAVWHAVFATAFLAMLGVKVLVVRLGGRAGRLLPLLGAAVFVLLALTWATSAGDFLL